MRTELLLLRHGQVQAAWRGRIYGCLDVPLSEAGRREARRAASFLDGKVINAVVSSGLSRTRYGAAWLARDRQIEVQHDADLREIERGAWAGLSFDELDKQEPGAMATWRQAPWNQSPPGGESMGALSDRVWPALDRIATDYPGQQVAVVAHRHVLQVALAKSVGRQAAMQTQIPTGSIVALIWTKDGPGELRWTKFFEEDVGE